jgi:hypothetical protein
MRVALLGLDHELVTPASYTVRWEIWVVSARARSRALLAALGACLPRKAWKQLGVERPPEYHGDPIDYGRVVGDILVGRGADMKQILRAGLVAFNALSEGLYTQEEVEASAVGFTPAEGGPQMA